jgi:hypothetical protein
VSEAVLELALRDLGEHVAWPDTPDVASAVRSRLKGEAEILPLRRRPVRRAVVLAAAAVLIVLGGMVALSPGLRAAILEFFSLPGVRIDLEESVRPPSSPPVTSPEAGVRAFLGRTVTLTEARRQVGFPIAVPTALGPPDRVFMLGSGPRALVTLAYGTRPGIPADPRTGYAVLVTELQGRPTEDLIKKVQREAGVIPVFVEGERGYWVEGAHAVYVRAPGGPRFDEARMAGNTLLWTRGPVTFRLEADITLGAALDLARTVA